MSPKNFRKISHPEQKLTGDRNMHAHTHTQTSVNQSWPPNSGGSAKNISADYVFIRYPIFFLADPPLVGSALDLHLSVCLCVCVCMRHQLTKLFIYFVLDEISFSNLLEAFLGCMWTSSTSFNISWMFMVLLWIILLLKSSQHSHKNQVLYEMSFWIFLETLLGCLYTCTKLFWYSCMSVSLLFGLLHYWN